MSRFRAVPVSWLLSRRFLRQHLGRISVLFGGQAQEAHPALQRGIVPNGSTGPPDTVHTLLTKLFAARDATGYSVFFACALSVSSAFFSIMDPDQTSAGVLRISDVPLQSAPAAISVDPIMTTYPSGVGVSDRRLIRRSFAPT
jgi:hypothetical protein